MYLPDCITELSDELNQHRRLIDKLRLDVDSHDAAIYRILKKIKEVARMYWTIEEWIPPSKSIREKGYWALLNDSETDSREQGREWFSVLKQSGRIVRLVEHAETVVAECLIPQEQL